MTDSPTDTWEFSLLVDRANRILEARGLFELYLGVRANQLVGRHLASYFDESERLAFLRYMARLLVRGDCEPVTARLQTPAVGSKRFSMAARNGDFGNSWWLMFSQEEKGKTSEQGLDTLEQPFATEEEFAALAFTYDTTKVPLDLTVFRAQALSPPPPSRLLPAVQQVLDDELGGSLLDHAHNRVVTRPDIGEYALLHGSSKKAEEISQSLIAVAERHNVSAPELGLRHETRSLTAGASSTEMVQDMRRKIKNVAPATPAQRLAAQARMNWIPAAVAGGCALVLLLVWLLTRTGT